MCSHAEHAFIVGEQSQQQASTEEVDHRKEQRHAQAPFHELHDIGLKALDVGRTETLAAQCFTGEGKSIHDIREEGEESQQQRVGRQDNIAAACTKRCERQVDRHQE